jgi:hypothetical protein
MITTLNNFILHYRNFIFKKLFISGFNNDYSTWDYDRRLAHAREIVRMFRYFRNTSYKLSPTPLNNIIIFEGDKSGVYVFNRILPNIYKDYDLLLAIEMMKVCPLLKYNMALALEQLLIQDLENYNCNFYLILGTMLRILLYTPYYIEVTNEIFMREYEIYDRTHSLDRIPGHPKFI